MVTPATLIATVGGEAVVHEKISSGLDIVRLVRQGLPVSAVDELMKTFGLALEEVDRIIIPRKTLSHRRKLHTLTSQQSERVLRAARVLSFASDTFGSTSKAMTWLRRPTRPLDDEKPLSLLDTEEGAQLVERLLGQIGHGIAA
jgi:putative toxin-antitoxin system antitoxin component (TIGR02293 family)